MRFVKMAPAVAVAAALLTLVPTAAARRTPRGLLPGSCRIGIEIAPRQITAGDPVTIFGRLRCHGRRRVARVAVRLFHHLPGSPGWSYVQTTTTDAHGFYELTRADGVVDTNRAWFVVARGAHSPARRIRVAAQVTLSGPASGTQLLTGRANAVTFTGTVSPADVGARVILQRQNAAAGSEWRRIDSGVVQPGPAGANSTGVFSIAHTFIVPGDANIRVLVRSQGRNVPSVSGEALEYEISQAQNPALSINASADPILFGQSVTISGTLAGRANQPVELLARTRTQGGFAPVAQAMTDGGGNYAFPAQSPVNSTFYRVRSAGQVECVRAPCPMIRLAATYSAVLYEGVRDVLTAQVSATTVPAGGQLVFSGAVAPSHPDHVIYLERQNASGTGFHVVQVALTAANSTYAIAHRVYDPGTKVFRVYVPGGPENEGAAGAPFTIQVTPSPAAALSPEAPGNSSLPAEGSEAPGER